MGEKPDSAYWTKGANTPKFALGALQQQNGAYDKKRGDDTGPLPTTSWALAALRSKPFTTFPRTRPPALKAFVFRPQMKSVLPKNGQKYTNTHSVLIRATYADGTKGTGVNLSLIHISEPTRLGMISYAVFCLKKKKKKKK